MGRFVCLIGHIQSFFFYIDGGHDEESAKTIFHREIKAWNFPVLHRDPIPVQLRIPIPELHKK